MSTPTPIPSASPLAETLLSLLRQTGGQRNFETCPQHTLSQQILFSSTFFACYLGGNHSLNEGGYQFLSAVYFCLGSATEPRRSTGEVDFVGVLCAYHHHQRHSLVTIEEAKAMSCHETLLKATLTSDFHTLRLEKRVGWIMIMTRGARSVILPPPLSRPSHQTQAHITYREQWS